MEQQGLPQGRAGSTWAGELQLCLPGGSIPPPTTTSPRHHRSSSHLAMAFAERESKGPPGGGACAQSKLAGTLPSWLSGLRRAGSFPLGQGEERMVPPPLPLSPSSTRSQANLLCRCLGLILLSAALHFSSCPPGALAGEVRCGGGREKEGKVPRSPLSSSAASVLYRPAGRWVTHGDACPVTAKPHGSVLALLFQSWSPSQEQPFPPTAPQMDPAWCR